MAENFYNPYQFIPVTGLKDDNPRTVPFQDIKDGKRPDIRHDLWQKNLKSGRIVCSVYLETPTVVGNQHDQPKPGEDKETIVHPYRIGGEYALPANSLRGMIGSVAETLSQSALRVLEREIYSVRKERAEGLSAIGLLRPLGNPQQDECPLGIVPLCLPTCDLNDHKGCVPPEWQALFPGRSLAGCLSAYVGEYYTDQNRLRVRLSSFLGQKHPDCYHDLRPEFFWARVHPDLAVSATLSTRLSTLPGLNRHDPVILGQLIEVPMTQEKFERDYPPDHPERPSFQRGILHVLGIDGRQEQIPRGQKKHERFIPVPDDLDTLQPIPITQKAWNDFMAMAAARADASKGEKVLAKRLPFLPKFYLENKDPNEYWKPESGELMYFRIECGRAVEISYTSIWRGAKDGTIHDAFGSIEKNLVPWGFAERTRITPAEYIFGVVDGKKREKNAQAPKSKNLASRVRFSDAFSPTRAEFLRNPPEPGEAGARGFQLPILSSPKPPSPALYFQDGRNVTKATLRLSDHRPNGRKVYLPHDPARMNVDDPPWVSARPNEHRKQKSLCWPLEPKQTFYFHIDFENLADGELHLLLKAIYPGPEYLHRLGLGKPLGLGAVKVRSCGVFLIDRPGRYGRNALAQESRRYSSSMAGAWSDEAATRYPTENAALDLPEAQFAVDTLVLVLKNTLERLCKAGSLAGQVAGTPIRYPYCVPGDAGEDKGFQWVVSNDRAGDNNRQGLKPVPAAADATLEPLNTLPPP